MLRISSIYVIVIGALIFSRYFLSSEKSVIKVNSPVDYVQKDSLVDLYNNDGWYYKKLNKVNEIKELAKKSVIEKDSAFALLKRELSDTQSKMDSLITAANVIKPDTMIKEDSTRVTDVRKRKRIMARLKEFIKE